MLFATFSNWCACLCAEKKKKKKKRSPVAIVSSFRNMFHANEIVSCKRSKTQHKIHTSMPFLRVREWNTTLKFCYALLLVSEYCRRKDQEGRIRERSSTQGRQSLAGSLQRANPREPDPIAHLLFPPGKTSPICIVEVRARCTHTMSRGFDCSTLAHTHKRTHNLASYCSLSYLRQPRHLRLFTMLSTISLRYPYWQQPRSACQR